MITGVNPAHDPLYFNNYGNNIKTRGEHNKAIEIARNMLAENLPEDTVSKLTGLTVSDVTALAKNSCQQEMHVKQRTVLPQRV